MTDRVILRRSGRSRKLPDQYLGMNSPISFAQPGDDEGTIPVTNALRSSFLRFPGGTVANFFDWRTGHLSVPLLEQASPYRLGVSRLAEMIKQRHPEPYTIEAFTRVSTALGSEIILVPNLETSTVGEQTAWFAEMAAANIVPRRIEMGNEFYLPNPEGARRFPDWRTALRISKEFLDGFERYLPPDARIAVQSAGTRFYVLENPTPGQPHRHWQWDDDMVPEPWFHAVTAHLYPFIDAISGPWICSRIARKHASDISGPAGASRERDPASCEVP